MTAYDIRGKDIIDDTHYVEIGMDIPLEPHTIYYFEVVSGGEKTQVYSVTTGAILKEPVGSQKRHAYGNIFLQGTTIRANNAIVYARIKDDNNEGSSGTSNLLSTIIQRDEMWSLNLNMFREEDNNAFFQYSAGDKLMLYIQAAGDGYATCTVSVNPYGTDTPVQDIILKDNRPPPDVYKIEGIYSKHHITLKWINPVITTGIHGIMIIRNTEKPPEEVPNPGSKYSPGDKLGDSEIICIAINTISSWIDYTAVLDNKYYYKIFTFDKAYNYSPGVLYISTPKIIVYPNPLIGRGYLYFGIVPSGSVINIYDTTGRLIMKEEIEDTSTWHWKPEGISSGVYFYMIKYKSTIYRGKIGIIR
jgi:hypothetical protein